MIEDARETPEGTCLEADICIVGAGPAGLTLARHFANSPFRIVLLESGGLDFEHWPQRLSRGTQTGDRYEPLHICRVRQFGGSTHKAGWGGWCKPLSRRDFTPREWVPSSGWPIEYDELAPYYRKAAQLLHLPPDYSWSASPVADGANTGLLSEPCAITPIPEQGKAAYPELTNSPNVRVLLHATAGRLTLADGSDAIGHLPVHRPDRKQFQVRSRYFVLASGGIENARMLLVANEQRPAGLGNQNDLVGRYFMEHPHIRWGHFAARGVPGFVSRHNPRVAQQAVSRGLTNASNQLPIAGLVISPDLQEREEILGSRSWIKPVGTAGFGPGNLALQEFTFWLRKGRFPPNITRSMGEIARNGGEVAQAIRSRLYPARDAVRTFSVDTIVEQEPRYSNRVKLDEKRDPLGMPRALLEWRIGSMVKKTFERNKKILTAEMVTNGLAEIPESDEALAFRVARGEQVRCVRHHMGTTRMAENEKSGVVDPQGRVFGVSNLYVAGSSVFPTGGNDMPTMTIVAMSLRLADHLNSQLSRH